MTGTARLAEMDWRVVLDPRGRWSRLVTAGSSPARAARGGGGQAYLAAPFAGEVALRGELRLERAVRIETLVAVEMVRLWEAGCVAVSPVVQRAAMSCAAGIAGLTVDPLDDSAWAPLARILRASCRMLVVPDLQGWHRCPAIWADVAWALERNLPVHVYAERAP